MKSEKFCFKKSTGFLALIGILLIASVLLMNTMTSQRQSTGTKAFFDCPNSSLAALSGICPTEWTAHDSKSKIIYATNSKDIWGRPAKCCYFATNYNGACPNGSSPDPNKWCDADKIITGKYVTRISDSQKIQCCNIIDVFEDNNGLQGQGKGSVAKAPTLQPVATLTPAIPIVVVTLRNQPIDFCTKLGLYDVKQAFATSFYNLYCEANAKKPLWSSPKCFAAIGMCGSKFNCEDESCMRGQTNSLRCLNMEVPFDSCLLAGVAQAKDRPGYAGMLCNPNDTCAGGVAINACAPNSIKRCVCKTGMKYPTYEDDTRTDSTRCKVNSTINCMYAEQVVTQNSYPYVYKASTVDAKKKCIQKDNKNTGFRCKTDDAGVINASGSVSDGTNCPLPAASGSNL